MVLLWTLVALASVAIVFIAIATYVAAIVTANTFAALHHPETRLDMARVGGALYGDVSADFAGQFRPILTVKARVAAVNHYPARQTVAYDRTYRLDRESWQHLVRRARC